MVADQRPEGMSAADVQAFAQKVEAWAQALTPKEQAFLEYILACAAAPGDTRGQAYDAFFKYDAVQKVEAGKFSYLSLDRITPPLLRIAGT